jgi:capsular polysaccharide biosynthesis protein
LAAARGWLESALAPAPETTALPPVDYWSNGSFGVLPAARVATTPSVAMRIPEAIIHGGNFSLVIEDRVFPGGFTHAFIGSPAWRMQGSDRVQFTPSPQPGVPAGASLLGMVSHWGHFFVDALDRLLALEARGRLDAPLLVGDPDFLGLRPATDARYAVPQVSQLIELLGIPMAALRCVPLYKQHDYAVRELYLCTLSSIKPAIPARALLAVRERAWRGIGTGHVGPDATLFVGRDDIRKRFVLNQDALVSEFSARGVATVFPEHLSAAQSVATFRAAASVVLPVGSAKFNLTYCRPGTKVVCVTPQGYAAQNGPIVTMTRHLCHALGLPLAFHDVAIQRAEPLVNSNLVITPADVDRILEMLADL